MERDQPHVAIKLNQLPVERHGERSRDLPLDLRRSSRVKGPVLDEVEPVSREPPVEERMVGLVLVRAQAVVAGRVAHVPRLVLELGEIVAGGADELAELRLRPQVGAVASAVLERVGEEDPSTRRLVAPWLEPQADAQLTSLDIELASCRLADQKAGGVERCARRHPG